jgi:prepilin-type N-terminal cleavage/methylation domain-containing protein/prepilin-type processing-associated H-X9-DG protein
MSRTHSPRCRGGFTLIELLVVISIIALLLSILLPTLGSARRTAQAAQCLSNMRQLGIATFAYVNDFRDSYPQSSNNGGIEADSSVAPTLAARRRVAASAVWFNALDYYLGQQHLNYTSADASLRNFAEFKQDPVWRQFPEEGNVRRDNRTIKMNANFGFSQVNPEPKWAFTRAQEVTRGSLTVLFVDGRGHDLRPADGANGHFQATEGTVGLRHDDAANVVFADGSGRRVKQAIRTAGLTVPGWFLEFAGADRDPRQELIWDFSR